MYFKNTLNADSQRNNDPSVSKNSNPDPALYLLSSVPLAVSPRLITSDKIPQGTSNIYKEKGFVGTTHATPVSVSLALLLQ